MVLTFIVKLRFNRNESIADKIILTQADVHPLPCSVKNKIYFNYLFLFLYYFILRIVFVSPLRKVKSMT